ncbi:hypothetical protein KDA_20590 [Dictyobacter alpinus]|uniref:Uncharacterized protein n=1 Tax=Dictyobacter alpinus TaxID=2014873 RepID=A0A402B5G0_9CHLR|nr:hypothetical protein KDA_20590 [Dictyobacter alpinus]
MPRRREHNIQMFFLAMAQNNVDNAFYSKNVAPLPYAKRHSLLHKKCTEDDEDCQLYFIR